MDDYLIKRIKELETENAKLREQVKEFKGSVYGQDNLKYLIESELKVLDLEHTRPYDTTKYKVMEAISQIIRQTFNLKLIRLLDDSNYEAAKEITETILKLIIKNFVKK